MAAPRLLLLPAAPISPVQGGLLFHGGEEGDAEMAVKGQIDDDIPGAWMSPISAPMYLPTNPLATRMSQHWLDRRSMLFEMVFTDCGSPFLPRSSTATGE